MTTKRRSIRITGPEDLKKVNEYREVKSLLEAKYASVVTEIKHHTDLVNAANQESISQMIEEFNSTMFEQWAEAVRKFFPDKDDLQQAFNDGSIYIDLSHYDDTGEVFVCEFVDVEELPALATAQPEKRVLH